MFEFNDAYIGVVAGGLSDEDTLWLFQEAFEEMSDEIGQVINRLNDGLEMEWDNQGPYVGLDQDQWDREFGGEDRPAAPRVRQAFIQSRRAAERAFGEVLQG